MPELQDGYTQMSINANMDISTGEFTSLHPDKGGYKAYEP
jgi:hypothetical protein